MKTVVIESHIPFVGDAFDGVANTVVLPSEAITRDNVRDADLLLVRTYNRCNAELLEGTSVSFVGTATIGTDHLDLNWLADNGIEAVNAPGCNAPAVAQWVLASILTVYPDPAGMTVGIVGVGHVGSIVDRWCRELGIKTLLCDPPRAEAENAPDKFVSLNEIAQQSDIITFHTPHTRQPHPYATHHMADRTFFSALKRRPMILNAARGPIVDTDALIAAIDSGAVSHCAIDCWEGEPDRISDELLKRVDIGTFHIAGYSLEGKKRATQSVVNAALKHLGTDRRIDLGVPDGANIHISAKAILDSYNPLADTDTLREAIAAGSPSFSTLRDTYPLRHEVGAI